MTPAVIGALLVFGCLVSAALWSTWHDSDYRWIAIALIGSFICSNLTWFLGPVSSRPGLYTAVEMIICLTAYLAWGVHRSRWMVGLVVISAASIAANVALASIEQPDRRQLNLHELLTNVCFTAECLIVIGRGIADGYRVGRFGRGADRGRRAGQLHGAAHPMGRRARWWR